MSKLSARLASSRVQTLLVIVAILTGGWVVSNLAWRARQELWRQTADIRFKGDVSNAMRWGREVLGEGQRLAGLPPGPLSHTQLTDRQFFLGYLGLYDRLYREHRESGRYGLDYTPARLAVMSLWMRWVVREHPEHRGYDDALVAPLLRLNFAVELSAALLGGLLVLIWLTRAQPDRSVWQQSRVWLASAAVFVAMLANPSTALNAHAWPQWDVWLLPFLLGAAVLGSLGWWLGAGAALAIGSSFKGQILIVAPVLALWPLMMGRPWSAARVLIGFAAAGLAHATPWLLRDPAAWAAVLGVSGAAWLSMTIEFRNWRFKPLAVLAVLASLATFTLTRDETSPLPGWMWALTALTLTAVAVASWKLHRRHAWPLTCATFVVLTLVAANRFDGSWSWFHVGYAHAQDNYRMMNVGPASNLPAILHHRYGFEIDDEAIRVRVPGPAARLLGATPPPADDPAALSSPQPTGEAVIGIRALLRRIFVISIPLAAVGLARGWLRRDPRGLLALVMPLVVMFAVVPQMHERYLVWAAAVGCISFGLSLAATLLTIPLILVSSVMMLHVMLAQDKSFAPWTFELIRRTHPDIGWAVLLLAGCWVYLGLRSGRRRPDRVAHTTTDRSSSCVAGPGGRMS